MCSDHLLHWLLSCSFFKKAPKHNMSFCDQGTVLKVHMLPSFEEPLNQRQDAMTQISMAILFINQSHTQYDKKYAYKQVDIL